jgi:hypothetical protein
MKIATAVSCLTLCLGPLAIAGQSPGTAQGQSFGVAQMTGIQHSGTQVSQQPGGIVIQLTPLTIGCPVSLRAQHLADGSLVRTRSGTAQTSAQPEGLEQWLHLTVTNPGSRAIRAATITVHGYSNKARVTQTLSGSQEGSDASWTTTLSFAGAEGRTESADVRVPGMTAVQTIELKTVTYADGSLWRLSGSQSCRVAPDPLMLVSGK